MNYELAKELKDAGFAQELLMSVCCDAHRKLYAGVFQGEGKDEVYIPTLSELIEACGEIEEGVPWFKKLNQHCIKETKESRNYKGGLPAEWSADSRIGEGMTEKIRTWGKTPEIAVAKLWLALNKK